VRCVRDERNPLCFKPEFISGSKKTQRLQRTARPKVARRNDEANCRVTPKYQYVLAEIHKKSATVDLHLKERI
jgi:hypothetical protein